VYIVEYVSLHDVAAFLHALQPEPGHRRHVPAGHNHPGALIEQPIGQPGAEEALCSRYQDAPAAVPAGRVHASTSCLHGAWPLSQSSFKSSVSL
jgi:hypothetical protein